MNYNTTDASCIAWPINSASVTDSEIDYMTVDRDQNLYRIMLSKRNLYLTATSATGKLYWRAATNSNNQLFKLLDDGGSSGGGTGSGIGLNFLRPLDLTHKITQGYNSNNLGIDYDGVKDDPIRAAGYGKVIYINRNVSTDSSKIESLGHTVFIEHYNSNGSVCGMTGYSHMNNIYVGKDQIVQEGDPIGTVGNTGFVIAGPGGDGSHLHFSLKIGTFFDTSSLYNLYYSAPFVDPSPYIRRT